jgi:hypothetical protein
MNRRSFFKFLGIGAATAAVAPKLLMDKQVPRDGQYFVDTEASKKGSACWAVVRNGQIIGVNIVSAGSGYKFSETYDASLERVVMTIDKELRENAKRNA